MSEEIGEACGVVGVFLPDQEAARTIYYCLFSMQHRGADAAGIAVNDNQDFKLKTGYGLVAQIFDETDVWNLSGHSGIGHVLCSSGQTLKGDLQPIVIHKNGKKISVAHNGHLLNADLLRRPMLNELYSLSHAEIISHLIADSPPVVWEERFGHVMRQLEGSYSLTVLTDNKVFGIRDPLGLKPLCVGRIDNGWVIASETTALDHLTATNIREIEPGEVVQLDENGLTSYFPLGKSKKHSLCSLEVSYIVRPDSRLDNRSAYVQRSELGAQLWREQPVVADFVIGVPDSAIPAAIGYSAASGIPFREGLVKNRYVGHTLVNPNGLNRDELKFNAMAIFQGQRVVVIDDRIELGITTAAVNGLLIKAGVREIHWRITTPPIIAKCHYGVAIGAGGELISKRKSVAEICKFIGADSLGFLSLEGLNKVLGIADKSCNGCFTGRYPTVNQLELPTPA